MKKLHALVGAAALVAICSTVAHAQVWTEAGDATQFPPGQITTGFGPLTDITGSLMGFGDVDMYCIEIFAPTAFGAWTETAYAPGTSGPAFATFDSQLWLFNSAGLPIMHSDDTTTTLSGMGFAQPNPIAGPPPPFFAPGIYMLAISQFDIDALGPGGGEIWADVPFGGWSGPDGTGAPLGGWNGGGFPGGPGAGMYNIVLSGATFCTIPAPGAAGVLAAGAILLARRRR